MHSNFHLKFHWRENYEARISTEEYVKRLYNRAGYSILKLTSSSAPVDKALPKLLWHLVTHVRGVPDFLVIDKRKKSIFFLEVKLPEEGLNHRQLQWIVDHPHLATAVLYVYSDRHRSYSWSRGQAEIKESCSKFRMDVDNPNTAEYILENLSNSSP